MKTNPKILDVIVQDCPGRVRYFIVLDKNPEYEYEKSGNTITGKDGDFYYTYEYSSPSWNMRAFGGWEFKIPLTDGTVIEANGQWWHGRTPGTISVGVGTLEELEKCYVFSSADVDANSLTEWLKNNTPKTDYYYYDSKRQKVQE